MRAAIPCLSAVLLGLTAAAVHADGLNVGVILSGQVRPGVYGRVEVGNQPPPVVYSEPVQVVAPPVYVQSAPPPVQPVYLHVPPWEAADWRRYCHRYDMCGRPVYFVRSEEYERGYYPHWRQERPYEHDRGHEVEHWREREGWHEHRRD
jgi:hypothetical protein